MDTSGYLLQLLSHDLPRRVPDLLPEQIITGESSHPRQVDKRLPRIAQMQDLRLRHLVPEICYVLEGGMGIKIGNRSYHLQKGDYGFVNRMVEHYESYVKPSVPYQALWFGFAITTRLWVLQVTYTPAGGHTWVDIVHIKIPPNLINMFKLLEDGKLEVAALKEKLTVMYKALSAAIDKKQYFFTLINQKRKWGKQQALSQVKKYIDTHLTEKLTLQELAGQVSITPQYLAKLFKQEYGNSLFEYIIFQKLLKALDLLTTTDLNITEIAYQLNYENIYYFSRLFKKYYGITPREFRAKYL